MFAGRRQYHQHLCTGQEFQVSDVTSTSNKDRISDGANNEDTQSSDTHSEDSRMIHQRQQSSEIFVRSFFYTSALFKIHQKVYKVQELY